MTSLAKRGPGWLEPALQTLRAHYFGGPRPGGWKEEDWSRASGAALAERLGPALSAAVSALGLELPKSCWAALTAARLENQRRAQDHESALDELAPALESRGLTAVVFKGPAMARHYPESDVREASDVDLLVPPAQLPQLEDELRRAGFQHWSGGGRQLSRYAVTYTRPSGPDDEIAFDLHPRWHEVRIEDDGTGVRVGETREPLQRGQIGAHTWRLLPPSVELYLTAAHAVLSSFRTLSVYLDLAVLAASVDDDALERAATAARAAGRDRHLRHALTLAGDLFAVDVAAKYLSLPARLGVPLNLRLGYVGQGIRFLPSSLVMELLLVRGLRRKLSFARWVMGHGERAGNGPAPASGVRFFRALRGLRWFKGTVLRYRALGSVALRS